MMKDYDNYFDKHREQDLYFGRSGEIMKKISLTLIVFFALLLSACAPASHEAEWQVVPKIDMSYDKAWPVVVRVITDRFGLEVVDAQSGYLRSEWKVTDSCWGGLAAGGMVPCKRARVVIRVENKSPFIIKVKAEKSAGVPLSNYNRWVTQGNDKKMEQEVLENLHKQLLR